jgi:hypothetical protein
MECWALLLGAVGAAFNLVAAVWLVMGSDPESERYTDDGELYPGRQVSRVVPVAGGVASDRRAGPTPRRERFS